MVPSPSVGQRKVLQPVLTQLCHSMTSKCRLSSDGSFFPLVPFLSTLFNLIMS